MNAPHKIAVPKHADSIEVSRHEVHTAKRVRKIYLMQFISIIIATALLSSAVTLTIATDGPTGFGTEIGPGSMVEAYSYIIFKDGSTYYARNGTTGAIEFSGGSSVVQSAINALDNGTGGAIQIACRVTLESPLYIGDGISILKNAVTIRGSYNAYYEGYDSPGFSKSGNFDLLTINGTPTGYCATITLENLVFQNLYGASGDGLKLHATMYVNIENCKFYGWYAGSAISATKSYKVEVNRCIIAYSGNALTSHPAIYIGGSGAEGSTDIQFISNAVTNNFHTYLHIVTLDTSVVYDNYFEGDGGGGYLYAVGPHLKIIHNHMWNCNGTAIDVNGQNPIVSQNDIIATTINGIDATDTYGAMITNNIVRDGGDDLTSYGIVAGPKSIIDGNQVINNEVNAGIVVNQPDVLIVNNEIWDNGLSAHGFPSAGIYLLDENCSISANRLGDSGTGRQIRGITGSGDEDNNSIVNNVLSGHDTYAINVIGTYDEVSGNIGYPTESKGTATISSSTYVTFDHNLVWVPTLVLASFSVASYGNYTWTATETQITITVSTSGTYTVYWYAEI